MKIKLTILLSMGLFLSSLHADSYIVGRWEELKELAGYPGSHAAINFEKNGNLIFEGPGAMVCKWSMINPKLIKVSGCDSDYQIKIITIAGDKLALQFVGNTYAGGEQVQYRRTVQQPAEDDIEKKPEPAKYAVKDKVKAEWKGDWYPAVILKVKDNKYFIHYDGFESSWDEWVADDRLKR